MQIFKRAAALCLGVAAAAVLSACSIPRPGFADYDVSGYVQALLDSSYHDSHEKLAELSDVSAETAKENNTTTVENAAVRFCNAYNILPSDEQLQELEVVMKQAYALTKYTVKEERKVDTGYYLEVEVAAITNFEGREADIEKLKAAAQAEVSNTNAVPSVSSPSSGEESSLDEDSWEDEDFSEESSEVSSFPAAPESSGEKVDVNALFVDKVLEFCKQELANISYDADTRSLPLDVRQTEEGELQLDMDQIESIDQAVVRF